MFPDEQPIRRAEHKLEHQGQNSESLQQPYANESGEGSGPERTKRELAEEYLYRAKDNEAGVRGATEQDQQVNIERCVGDDQKPEQPDWGQSGIRDEHSG